MAVAVGERVVLLYIEEHRKKITFCGYALEHLVKAISQNNQIDFLIPTQDSILFQIWDDDFNEFIDLDHNSEIPNKSKIKVLKVKNPHPIAQSQKSILGLPSTMTVNTNQPPVMVDSYLSNVMIDSKPNVMTDSKPILPINQNQALSVINTNQNQALTVMNTNRNHALTLMNANQNQAMTVMNTNQHMLQLNSNQLPLMIDTNHQMMALNSNDEMNTDDPIMIEPSDYPSMLVDITLESDSPSPDNLSGELDIKGSSPDWDASSYQLPKFSVHLQSAVDTKESLSKQDRRCLVKELFQNISKHTWYPDRYYSFIVRELISKYPHLRDHSHSGFSTWLSDLKIKFSNERRKLSDVEECVKRREFCAKNRKAIKEAESIPAEDKNEDKLLQITNVLSTSSDSPSGLLNEGSEKEESFSCSARPVGGKLKNIHNYQLPEFSERVIAALQTGTLPTRRLKRWIIHELFLDLIQYYTWYPTKLYPQVIMELFKKYPHLKSNVYTFNTWLADLKMKFGNERRKLNEDFRICEKELSKSLKKISEEATPEKVNYGKQVTEFTPAAKNNDDKTTNAVSTSSDSPTLPVNDRSNKFKNINKYQLPEFSSKVNAALMTGSLPTRRTKWWIIDEIFQDLRQYSSCPNKMYAQIIMQLFKKYPHLKSDAENFNAWVSDLKIKFKNEKLKLSELPEKELELHSSIRVSQDELDYDKQGQSQDSSSDCSIVNEKWSVEPALNSSYVSTTSNQLVPVDTKLSYETNEAVEDDSQMEVDSQTQMPLGYQLPRFTVRLRDVLNGDEPLTRKHKRWIVDEIFVDLSQYTWYPQNCRDIVSSLLTTYPSLEIDGISFNTWLSDLKMKFANERRKLNKVDLFYAKQSAKLDNVLITEDVSQSVRLSNKVMDKS